MNPSDKNITSRAKISKASVISEMTSKLKKINNNSLENDSNHKLKTNEMELKILNCDELYEKLNDIIFKEITPQNIMSGQFEFDRTQYASKESFSEFFSKLSNYKKLIRKGILNSKTPSFNFLEAAEKFNIVANPIGLLKRNGNSETINLKHCGKGDNHIQALTNSLKIADHITELDLGDNRLTKSSVVPMFDALRTNVKCVKNLSMINLSFNKLGKESINALSLYIQEPDCELSHINLEANCLGNDIVISLLNNICIQINHKLKYINLGQNNLTDLCAFSMANFVEKCAFLKVLILYWNGFRNHGASMIVSKIKKHFELKFFDISWNLIGNSLLDSVPNKEELEKSNKESKTFINSDLNEIRSTDFNPFAKKKLNPLKSATSPFAKELGELFKEKTSELIHLDISHNNIAQTDFAYIKEEVKNNHVILGIHCDGNEGMIDELGFIEPVSKSNFPSSHFANSQIYYKISEEHPLINTNVLNVRKIRAKNNCWICEGWRETKFVYNLKHNNYETMSDEPPVVKLHLSFENYKPYDTTPRGDQYVCHRMCPPGEFLFYFTVNGVPVDNFGTITHNLKEAVIHLEKDTNGDTKEYIITKIAKSFAEINPHVIDSDNYRKMIQYCEPRPEKKIIQKIRPRTPWSFSISVWATYEYSYDGEPEELYTEAFEFDFKRSNIGKELQDGEATSDLKKLLRGYYKKVIECYRYLASSLGSNIWQINKNTMFEFVNSMPGLITDAYNLNIMFLKQTEAINNLLDKHERQKNKNKNVPDNIIRHQFLTLLSKVAVDKYLNKSNMFKLTIDAIHHAFENNYMPVIKGYDIHSWRIEKYYNELVDNVLKAYYPIFNAIYKSWTPIKDGRRDIFLNLDSFNSLMIQIVDNEFPVREIPICFNHSIKLQANEIDFDKHLKLIFPEFLEAFCRVVDKLSPIPFGDKIDNWTLQSRQDQHLSNKIENVIPILMKLITNPEFKLVKEKFPFLSRDEETGLVNYDSNHPWYSTIIIRKTTRRASMKKATIMPGA